MQASNSARWPEVGCGVRATLARWTGPAPGEQLFVLIAMVAALAAAERAPCQEAGGPAVVEAAPTTSTGLEEVTVIANRRQENNQDVPIAIKALTASQLQSSGIDSSDALAAAVPGLTMQNSGSGLQPHLRGVGNSAFAAGQENSIATYVDGVYITSLNGVLVNLNDIQQIEVDKGPQGTLFGRNATGGVINITTKDPTQQLSGIGSISYGNYNTISTNDYLAGGVSQNLAASIAVHYSYQGDGWGKNVFDGSGADKTRDLAVRSKWVWVPGDNDRLTASLDYEQSYSTWLFGYRGYASYPTNWGPGAPAPFGQPFVFPGGYWDVDLLLRPYTDVKQGGASLNYKHDFDSLTLTSITADRVTSVGADLTPQPFPSETETSPYQERERQFSEELRLSSLDTSRIKWVLGLYYLDASQGYSPLNILGPAIASPPMQSLNFRVYQTTKSYAAFGQATTPIPGLANTDLTGGLRWTSERRGVQGYTFLGFIPSSGIPDTVVADTDAHKTFDKLTWRLALDHHFTPDVLGYLSYNLGFKSGVYNTIPPSATPVNPEVLYAYEAGIKTDLLDRRVRVNAAAFYYNYSQMQVMIYTPLAFELENGARSRIYGLDFDADSKITDQLTLRFGLNALHSTFVSFPAALFLIPQSVAQGGGNIAVAGSAKGNNLPYTPNLTFDLSPDYTIPLSYGTLDLSATYAYSSHWFAGPGNIAKSPDSKMLNAQIGLRLRDARTYVGLWAKNLLNQAVPMIITEGANPGGGNIAVYAPPRTYGVTLQYAFGD